MMKLKENWVVYGSGLSALVLAERLGNAGRTVTLANPMRSWGGIFGGVPIGQEIFDAGMTNFEFELFGQPDDALQNYDPGCKADIGKYVHYVKAYIERFADVRVLPAPRMIYDGRIFDDLIISNHFDVLRALPEATRRQIVKELTTIVSADNDLHPRSKSMPDSPLSSVDFDRVSRANHGPTLHTLLVEPMFRKVLNIPTTEIAGIFHRNGWAPLFYPETLLSQFGDAPQNIKPTVFHYPEDKNFGAFIGRIVDSVRAMANVRILTSVKDVQFDLSKNIMRTDQGEFAFDRLAWAGELRQLNIDTGGESQQASRRASLDLFFLNVKREGVHNSFTALMDPEPATPFYRVTNQTVCHGRDLPVHQIILECNSANWDAAAPNAQRRLDAALSRYGIEPEAVTSCTHKTFNGALGIPSLPQMIEFNQLRKDVTSRFPDVYLMGPSSGYVSVTLNDHIIQALKIAQAEGVLA